MPLPYSRYREYTGLLVRVLPHVAAEPVFALKGGTAINLFVRDLPRLSVDIDLVYLPDAERDAALAGMNTALRNVAVRIRAAMPAAQVQIATIQGSKFADKLLVSEAGVQIKIEVNHVFRGTVHPAGQRDVAESVEASFGYARIQVVSFDDMYAGKLVAALDRQHPRDLFDVRLLLDNEGLSASLFNTFLVYLIGHNRTMAEVLDPPRKDIRAMYEEQFTGMTQTDVGIEPLLDARDELVRQVQALLGERERAFLLSFKNLRPDWSLLGSPGVENLPAVRWKLQNLERMAPERRVAALGQLETLFNRIA